LPVLLRISDSWLLNKNTREKGFSLVFFDENYVRSFDEPMQKKSPATRPTRILGMFKKLVMSI